MGYAVQKVLELRVCAVLARTWMKLGDVLIPRVCTAFPVVTFYFIHFELMGF